MINKKSGIIFTGKKAGHYASYADLVIKISNDEYKWEKTSDDSFKFSVLKYDKVIFIDGDDAHIKFIPIAIFRSLLLGKSTFFFSVRSEDFFSQRLKSKIKKFSYQIMHFFKNAGLISIHKPHLNNFRDVFFRELIYDPQLWDMQFLGKKIKEPIELKGKSALCSHTVVVIGSLNEKRCVDKLVEFLKSEDAKNLNFILAGKIDTFYNIQTNNLPNVTLIDRYLEDEEIFYLYDKFEFFYNFYEKKINRPSGIFGRVIQHNKTAIVRKNGYIHKNYSSYSKLLPIDSIEKLKLILENNLNIDEKSISINEIATFVDEFDDSELLKKLICQ